MMLIGTNNKKLMTHYSGAFLDKGPIVAIGNRFRGSTSWFHQIGRF